MLSSVIQLPPSLALGVKGTQVLITDCIVSPEVSVVKRGEMTGVKYTWRSASSHSLPVLTS